MTYDYINAVSSKILAKFKNSHPGLPLKEIAVLDPLRKEHMMDYQKASNVYLMLLFADVLKQSRAGWVELTERGYRVKLKGIDGGPHKRRNMWFNSMIREEPYPGSNGK